MREIKYRAWTGNRMIDFEEVCDMHATPWNSTSLCWMQFTGLLDKNGVEIYEGDIVEWHIGKDTIDLARQEIKWSNEYQGFLPLVNITTKVIGNIYENPSLLSKEL